jgi:hypothetical protein
MTFFCIHKFPPKETFDHYGYPAVDRCIYCGTTEGELTKEHIIGKALNGTLTLARSSCEPCRKITHAIETFCFDGHMKGFRVREGFRTSKLPPFNIPLMNKENVRGVGKVSREDHLAWLILPKYQQPAMFYGAWPEPIKTQPWTQFRGKWPRDHRVAPAALNFGTYTRMLYKIAHGYAVAEIGYDGFEHFLPKCILDTEKSSYDYIGSVGPPKVNLPKEERLHRLSLEYWENKDGIYLIVNIRLFAYAGAPDYHVIAGKVPRVSKSSLIRLYSSKIPSAQTRQ